MAVNYINFSRGTEAAYNKSRKDPNTLYFVYPSGDDKNGALYMGARLISGGNINIENSSIDALIDVIINEVQDGQILVYDNNKKAWTNKSAEELVKECIITSVDTEVFGLDNGKLTLKKVPVGILEDNPDSASRLLLTPVDRNKLNNLVIEEDGSIAISGTIAAEKVQGLQELLNEKVSNTDFNNLITVIGNLSEYLESVESNSLAEDLESIHDLLIWKDMSETTE